MVEEPRWTSSAVSTGGSATSSRTSSAVTTPVVSPASVGLARSRAVAADGQVGQPSRAMATSSRCTSTARPRFPPSRPRFARRGDPCRSRAGPSARRSRSSASPRSSPSATSSPTSPSVSTSGSWYGRGAIPAVPSNPRRGRGRRSTRSSRGPASAARWTSATGRCTATTRSWSSSTATPRSWAESTSPISPVTATTAPHIQPPHPGMARRGRATAWPGGRGRRIALRHAMAGDNRGRDARCEGSSSGRSEPRPGCQDGS